MPNGLAQYESRLLNEFLISIEIFKMKSLFKQKVCLRIFSSRSSREALENDGASDLSVLLHKLEIADFFLSQDAIFLSNYHLFY